MDNARQWEEIQNQRREIEGQIQQHRADINDLEDQVHIHRGEINRLYRLRNALISQQMEIDDKLDRVR